MSQKEQRNNARSHMLEDLLFPIMPVEIVDDEKEAGGYVIQHKAPMNEWVRSSKGYLGAMKEGGKKPVVIKHNSSMLEKFIDLGSTKNPKKYLSFANKFGFLIYDDFFRKNVQQEWLMTGGNPFFEVPAYKHKESLLTWRWHAERLHFFDTLYSVLKSDLAPNTRLQKIERVLSSYLKLYRHGELPDLVSVYESVKQWSFSEKLISPDQQPFAESRYNRFSPIDALTSEKCYSPHHEFFFRPVFRYKDRDLMSSEQHKLFETLYVVFIQRHVQYTINSLCRPKLNFDQGQLGLYGRGVLGECYLQFARKLMDLPKLEIKNCLYCGEPFIPERANKKFCLGSRGDRCKQAYYRQQKALRNQTVNSEEQEN